MWQELLLWHNWRKTALIFILTLTLLLDIAVNPIISVMSVAGAIILGISMCYCCYVWGMRKLHKSNDVKHPCQRYLDMDVTISEETAEQLADLILLILNPILLHLRSLFLVEDLFDSLKLLLLLCSLNIVGDHIDGMTLLLAGFVLLFTVPKLYEWKKPTINMQLLQLQQLKTLLLSSENKKIPIVSVDPKLMSPNSIQDPNGSDNELDDNGEQFNSFDQDNEQDFTSEYNWYDTLDVGYDNIKQT
ncbi:GH17123 [Drosophila grimshawi]|uniref:Reticulon-like protein n=2 Tax=Drosophila grimshawi TaxID=7222 RepID=B4J0N2_DROGR|nr:GH17123 [Drosophila grimshawi]